MIWCCIILLLFQRNVCVYGAAIVLQFYARWRCPVCVSYMLAVHSVHLYICTDLNINLKALKIEFISHKTKLSLRFLLVQAHRMGCCSSIIKKNICLFRWCSMILFSLRKKIWLTFALKINNCILFLSYVHLLWWISDVHLTLLVGSIKFRNHFSLHSQISNLNATFSYYELLLSFDHDSEFLHPCSWNSIHAFSWKHKDGFKI